MPPGPSRPDGPGEVVVTGLGAVSSLGGDVPSTWRALRASCCGVRILEDEWVDEFRLPVRIGAPLATDVTALLTVKERRRLDRASQCALLAAREAWVQARSPRVEAERLAVSLAPGMGPVLSVMGTWDTLRSRGPRRVAPTAVPALMPNAPAATVGIELGAAAGIHSPVSACASGAEAIAYGADLIRLGRADVVVAGGTDAALHPMTVAAFAAMRALSTRNEEPLTASRPFAPDRDGFVLSEGAGVLVLESGEHARGRGAHVLAIMSGTGVTADAFDVARPEPSGTQQERALRRALEDAGLGPDQVGHVNAHATSTPAGDAVEAGVLSRTVPQAAVSATKSATGHPLGGAGGLEAVLTIMALITQWAPPTLLPAGMDPQIATTGLDVVGPGGRPLRGVDAAVSTSFGFGGHNVALVFSRGPAATGGDRTPPP
ncbi:beta-ketoacyl-[acyl-carrier-protein] synthase family protein [Actinomyces sp. 2119]|uniref:Beta-ketoacyl-[acyl-carrier-protein] synthase family protein n=1 Tax=Actinomyces lilanjuaniae TaxID=2321394 RepID=A0ABN5PMZ4_9ACTO|nr:MULTISPECIES: beta-ketoacyl-[acyl-carrier-protein] synthase family protein [Actinomyces]AYD89701.1 beta-ketoacyl-[acyl-carrier-protein] synthase family protein [Actinomyces lilanjuaniae]RJF44664.1 beta-ketoacyl-[acyl-carrier-protein] synthase family protein [Actinomyces sp. 2119]